MDAIPEKVARTSPNTVNPKPNSDKLSPSIVALAIGVVALAIASVVNSSRINALEKWKNTQQQSQQSPQQPSPKS